MAAATSKSMRRGVSNVGKAAEFGTPEEEVARIIAHKQNYYICLKVLKDSSASDIRNNYFRLSRLVHPDKCSHPQAADASAVINQAKDTLTNPMKKTLYDAYVTDVTQSGDAASEMTYAEWEAAQAAYPVKIPAWLENILRTPVLGQIIALIMLLLLIPLVLVFILIGLVLWILCIPVNILVRCCCGAALEEQARRQREAAEGGGEGASYVPPGQQTAGSSNV